jgi:alkylation response protein AidB-like acyl-CoA dehydrogenase
LARDAAFHGADPDRAAAAAVHAVRTARQVYNETHQIQGAIGFTDEYDLHLWTLRLRALAVEAGGSVQHSRDLVQSRWEMACP